MTEKELREQLQDVYGDVPSQIHAAFQHALTASLRAKGEDTMKKRIAALPVLAVVLMLLVGGVACAAVSQVMGWYYQNRATYLREQYPERYAAMMDHVLTDIPQTQSSDALVNVQVSEAVWLPEEQLLVLAVTAAPRDSQTVELHPLWNLDADGSYVGSDLDAAAAQDSEDRAEHWLWTDKGHGPVRQMMANPDKSLVLMEACEVNLGTTENPDCRLNMSMDALDIENGAVLFMLEGHLDEETMNAYRVADGWEIPMTLFYTVHPYEDGIDDLTLYTGTPGSVVLTLRVKE
ncbi:MAG: hypothetical protein ACI4MJ_04825 [Aristaeellaceae bacterium]